MKKSILLFILWGVAGVILTCINIILTRFDPLTGWILWFCRAAWHVLNCCHVQLFVTLWTIAHQAPLPMGFSRQEYWSGLPNAPVGMATYRDVFCL